MPSQAKLKSPLSGRRIQIRDRIHAREIASAIAFGTLFKNGGTVEGFADWLFVNRQTFNGPNPLHQARVYANGHLAAKRRGDDFDVICRARADENEEISKRVEANFKANIAAIKTHWTETIDGRGIVLTVAELCLGRGRRFAASPDGEALPDPPSWVLRGLLKLLEEFGGPDQSPDEYDWRLPSAEEDLRKFAPTLDKLLVAIREDVLQDEPPSEYDFACVARAARLLSRISWVRTTLRTLLTQVQMVERIEASASHAANTGPAPARLRRLV
jgi:hypothetical protein